ncbi:hypothetical protein MMC18_003491 [Xylographa bjoerkii]|nr:hypothetical protein [Xylographa bjoerkii]
MPRKSSNPYPHVIHTAAPNLGYHQYKRVPPVSTSTGLRRPPMARASTSQTPQVGVEEGGEDTEGDDDTDGEGNTEEFKLDQNFVDLLDLAESDAPEARGWTRTFLEQGFQLAKALEMRETTLKAALQAYATQTKASRKEAERKEGAARVKEAVDDWKERQDIVIFLRENVPKNLETDAQMVREQYQETLRRLNILEKEVEEAEEEGGDGLDGETVVGEDSDSDGTSGSAVSAAPENMTEAEMPLSVRRKRRASTSLAGSSPSKGFADTGSTPTMNRPPEYPTPQTPTKAKKKVRFSDPGPDISSELASTGITPHIKRTTLRSNAMLEAPSSPRLLSRAPRRRKSLPAILTAPSSSGLPTPPLSGEIQFEPLRQILDDRTKRRLKRNNLSDEINDIDAGKRADSKRKEEITELKEQLALARQLGREIVGHKTTEIGNHRQILELEQEICKLKEEMRERSMTAETHSPVVSDTEQARGRANDSIYEDLIDEDDFHMIEILQDCQDADAELCAEAGTQTHITSSEVNSLQEHIRQQTEYLVRARLDLEYICPGETSLGLTADQGNSKPILDAFLNRLEALKAQLRVSQGALATSRTQESNLRNQFNTVLMQLDSARSTTKDLSLQNKHAASLNGKKIEELEVNINEKERSIEKLQNALETYRREVKDLENLVNRLESEHTAKMSNLRSEMDEAVADLDCHVVAETLGRREAEQQSEKRMFKIKQLETMEKELKDAVNSKQCIVRGLEEELDTVKQERQCEVGVLNVKISELSSALSEVKADMSKTEAERARLVKCLVDERLSAKRIVDRMQGEMEQCLKRVVVLQGNFSTEQHDRGTEVVEHKGLLTPVDAVRFKDMDGCEGYVEVSRGKSRKKRGIDSGVVILEEDEDEDEAEDLVT